MRASTAIVLSLVVAACSEKPPANEVRASGHVEATDVRLAPEVGGRIVLLPVKEGDRVEAGTLILRLDDRDHALAVQRAKAEQSHAEAQLRLLERRPGLFAPAPDEPDWRKIMRLAWWSWRNR